MKYFSLAVYWVYYIQHSHSKHRTGLNWNLKGLNGPYDDERLTKTLSLLIEKSSDIWSTISYNF